MNTFCYKLHVAHMCTCTRTPGSVHINGEARSTADWDDWSRNAERSAGSVKHVIMKKTFYFFNPINNNNNILMKISVMMSLSFHFRLIPTCAFYIYSVHLQTIQSPEVNLNL